MVDVLLLLSMLCARGSTPPDVALECRPERCGFEAVVVSHETVGEFPFRVVWQLRVPSMPELGEVTLETAAATVVFAEPTSKTVKLNAVDGYRLFILDPELLDAEHRRVTFDPRRTLVESRRGGRSTVATATGRPLTLVEGGLRGVRVPSPPQTMWELESAVLSSRGVSKDDVGRHEFRELSREVAFELRREAELAARSKATDWATFLSVATHPVRDP